MKKNVKVEGKLWPELSYPCSYATVLDAMSKQELTNVRTNLRIKNVSQLNKSALAEKLAELIPQHIQESIQYWDEQRVTQFQAVLSKQGFSTNNYMDMKQSAYFYERGMLFQGTVEGRKGLLMPEELVQSLHNKALIADQSQIRQNTELLKIVRGMLYYYGVLSLEQLSKLLPSYIEGEINLRWVNDVLQDACNYYEDMGIEPEAGFYHTDVENPLALSEHISKQYADLPYYPYSKAELLKASDAEFLERNSQFKDLLRFILEHYDMERENAELMIELSLLEVKNGGNIQNVLNLVQDFIEIPEQQYAGQLFNKLAAVLNHTSQWLLKGHNPSSLSAKQQGEAKGDVVSAESKKRVGRNDPCPCGSGKKFKKCCMA